MAERPQHILQMGHVLYARDLKKTDQLVELDAFVEGVRRSGLVAEHLFKPILDRCALDVPGEKDAREQLMGALVEARLLTPWQGHILSRGYSQGFCLGKYKLLHLIGVGGGGAVYLAEHTLIRRRVAIKVVLPPDDHSSSAKRFLLESRAVALLDHPNILRVYHYDTEAEFQYLVMEYLEGADLSRTVRQHGPLPFEQAADLIRQASDGLAHAHQADLVHRDIKPANLHLDREGHVKVLDLGLVQMGTSQLISITSEYQEAMLGTIDYIAPEQILDSSKVDHRADIYSLGCTLYFLLTGQPPYTGGGLGELLMKRVREEPTPIQTLRADIPSVLISICEKMMAKKPADRFQSAKEVSRALMKWLASRTEETAVGAEQTVLTVNDEGLSLDEVLDASTHMSGAGYSELRAELGSIRGTVPTLQGMSAAVSQRFSNLIQGVLGHAELALLKVPDDSDLAHSLREITQLAEQGATFADRLRVYSGTHPLSPVRLNLQHWLTNSRPVFEALLDVQTKLELQCDQDFQVEFDPAALKHVLTELVVNAVEAIGIAPGKVTIKLGPAAGPGVNVSVSDTGPGIAIEAAPLVFEPFYTTKLVGRGLGLSLARELVTSHHGSLVINAAPERGACFTMMLPARASEPDEPESVPEPTPQPSVILVVDDEASLRNLSQQALESAGYKVLTAENGSRAIEMFREQQDQITCVLIDKEMPGMSGPQAVAAMHKIRDTLPAILCSGFPPSAAEATEAQFVGFLQKPYRMQNLVKTVKDVLGCRE